MITPLEKEALRDFISIAKANNIPFVLVGANARLLAFDLKYNIPSTRATKDWDIAIQVNWESYEVLRYTLTKGDRALFLEFDQHEHRFKHANGVQFDIIPFGEVEQIDGTIVWPSTEQKMTVVGFNDVIKYAQQLIIDDDIEIPVATAPGLVVLKIFAFNDRRRNDDLRDLYFILNNYDKADNEDRIFEELSEYLSSGELDYESAKAFLLGKDVMRLISPKTHGMLVNVLDDLQLINPYSPNLASLLTRLGDQREEEHQRINISKLFEAFLGGIAMED
ncbi:MAG: nucleotidyl transferase AbiEii/AbiGii toxin family protein [Desulfobaccales bacterium]